MRWITILFFILEWEREREGLYNKSDIRLEKCYVHKKFIILSQ